MSTSRFPYSELKTLPVSLGLISFLAINPALAEQSDSEDALEEVVVTATMKARSVASAPAFSSVFSAEDLAEAPVNSLSDFLDSAVGISNLADASGRDELQIRGLGGEYTVILVNGKRVSSAGAMWRGGDFDLNSVPLGDIERIEIIRGPMSSLYGADAIGGVVNIITKQPTDEWSGQLGAEYRAVTSGKGGDQYRANASISGALSDSVDLALGAEKLGQDAWYADGDASTSTDAPDREEKKALNLNSTISWQVNPNHALQLELARNRDERPYALYSGGSASREQDITRTDIGLNWTGQWENLQAQAYIKSEHSDIHDYNSSYDDPQSRNLEEDNLYTKAWLSGSIGFVDWLAGFDRRTQTIKDAATYLDTGEYDVTTNAWFAQGEAFLTDDFSVTLGGRLDDHELFGQNFSPKAYAVYQLSDALTLKGGVSKAFKAPDGSKLSAEYAIISCGGDCTLAGNPDLEPETSINYEAGFELKLSHFDLTMAYFNNRIKDLIEREVGYDTDGNPISAEWINVAKATTKGYEAQGSYDLTDSMVLSANYTRLMTSYEDADGNKVVLEHRPEHEAGVKLNWQALDRFNVNLDVAYKAGMQYSAWSNASGSWVQVYNKLPGYYVWNLGMASDIGDDLKLTYGVKNLSNTRLDNINDNYNGSVMGRSVYLGARYQF